MNVGARAKGCKQSSRDEGASSVDACFAIGPALMSLVALVAVVLLSAGLGTGPASAETQLTGKTPLKISVHVSSDRNRCYAPGLVEAIRHFTSAYADEVNGRGGIADRKITLEYLDDFEVAETTIKNVTSAIQDPNTIAMIGLPSSTRGRAVFDAVGGDLKTTGIPFITEMSLDQIFRDWPNVFTMASSVRNELEVVQKMIREGGYQRPAYVGVDDDLYSFALEDGVANNPGGPELVARLRIPIKDYKIAPDVAQSTAATLAEANPDIVVTSIHSGPTAGLLKEMGKRGIRAPVLVLLGRIATISGSLDPTSYLGPLSQIAREGVPYVFSERLRHRIWRSPDEKWVFPNIKLPDTAGWADGRCQESKSSARTIYDAGNRRAVGRGMQYRDVLGLIVQAGSSAEKDLTVDELRKHIGQKLRSFVEGRHVLRGVWRDIAFTTSRTAAEDTLLLTKTPGDPAIVLSPMQYQRINGELIETPALYMTIDLVSLSHIDTNDQSFDAEFYLSMKSTNNDLRIEDIDFTNARRSQVLGGKLLNFREIHGGTERARFPAGVKLYKVSGKFLFQPELSRYPFDAQRFSISFQPASTEKSFLVQPPADRQRITNMAVDGWRVVDQYVGADQDIIPTIGASLSERRIVPFYKFNATWVAERISIDYYTRVVIPLMFILLVTYFSVFLPHSRFDSLMGIQVTALLSAIALYLALPKVDTDQATLSDKIFMVTYAAVSIMIGLSILRERLYGATRSFYSGSVTLIQKVVFPLAVLAAIAALITFDRLPGTASAIDIVTRLFGISFTT